MLKIYFFAVSLLYTRRTKIQVKNCMSKFYFLISHSYFTLFKPKYIHFIANSNYLHMFNILYTAYNKTIGGTSMINYDITESAAIRSAVCHMGSPLPRPQSMNCA